MASEQETFLRLTLPEPTVILGQELLPVSIGHLLWLDRLELLPAIEPEQIITAILICTREAADIAPTLKDPWLEWKIRLWLFRVAPFKDIDWGKQMLALAKYIEEGTETPSTISRHDSGDNSMADSGTPFLQHIKATLQSRLNYTPAEAVDCPFVQAMWDFYAWHEMEGHIQVCDRAKRKEMRERADHDHDALVAEAVEMLNKKPEANHAI